MFRKKMILFKIQTADNNEIVTQIDELNFEIMPINSNKEIIFAINNSNPIDVIINVNFKA
jgi:hypothetical protein